MESLNMQLQPFFEWLLRTTLQASLLICLILLFQVVLRSRLGARWHYCLWLLLLIRMAMPWAPQSQVSVFNLIPQSLPQRQTEYIQQDVGDDAVSSDAASPSTAESTPVSTTEVVQDTSKAITVAPEIGKEAQGQLKSAFFEIAAILPLVWLTGALVLAVYVCASNFNLLRIVKRERPLTDQKILDLLEDCKAEMGIRIILGIVTTDKVKSPALFGFIRPRLLLPKGMLETLSREELRYVFLHELAHLKRHDIYIGWLMSLLQVLHWFNPLIWLAFYRLRADRELACDALVLARTQSGQAKDYGRTIVNLLERFSRSQRLPAMAGILETKAQLKRRITMITRFKKNSYQWSPWAIVLIIILACISLPDAKRTRASETLASKPAHQANFRKNRIPTKPGNGVLSPDGKKLAFVSKRSIWVVPVHGKVSPDIAGEPVRLPGTKGAWRWGMSWSADGKWIAYNIKRNNKVDEIHVISSTGGEPKKIPVSANRGNHVLNYRLSLSPDGKVLAFASKEEEGTNKPQEISIYTIPVDGGVAKRLTDPGTREPAFSPDGKKIAYVKLYRSKEGRWVKDIWVIPASGGTPVLFSDLPGRGRGPVWSPDGKMIAFNREPGEDNESNEIWIVPVSEDGKAAAAPTKIKLPLSTCDFLAGWTSDNKIGLHLLNLPHRAIYTAPASGGNAVQVTPAGWPFHPRWSPDGKRIFFRWDGGDIASVPVEGGEVSTIPLRSDTRIFEALPGGGNAVSPDGKKIVFAGAGFKKGVTVVNIWTIPVEGGEPTQLTTSPGQDRFPCWSPDGKKIAFIRYGYAEPLKEMSICIVSTEGGEVRQLTSESHRVLWSTIAWSPDGKSIAYFSDDKAIKVIPVQGGESRVVVKVEDVSGHSELAWSPDGSKLVYSSKGSIWVVSLDGGEPEEIKTGLDAKATHISWSPDGKKIAFTGSEGGDTELWLMENFLPGAPVAKPEPAVTLRRVWAGPDVDLEGAPSPNGRYLSYVDWDTGDLAVYEIATGKKRRLTNKGTWDESDEFAQFSKWSPDGKQIVYDWYNGNDFIELRIVGLDGSKPRTLYGNEEVVWAQTYDWSPDGKQILACFSRKDGPDQIVLVFVSDGSERILKTFDSKWPDKISFSPDGRYIVYDLHPKKDSPDRDIFLLSTDGRREIPLVEHPASDYVLGWTPDGKHILFVSDRTGSPDIWVIRVTEGSPQGVPELVKASKGPFSPVGLGFTRDGSFYYGHRQNRTNVYIAEIDPETGKIIVPPNEAISRFVESNGTPDYSPDGKYLAYVSRRPPRPMRYTTNPIGNVLCVRSLETGEEREFKPEINVFGWPRWSPDGRSVMVVAWNLNSHMGYYQIDTQTGNVTPLLPTEGRNLLGGHDWSLDGKAIYYGRRDRNTKKYQVFVRDLESGIEKVLYRSDERFDISLSPDGQQLALLFISNEKQTLNVIPAEGGESRELCRFEKGDGFQFGRNCSMTWSADGKYILYTMRKTKVDDAKWELCRIPAEGGEPQKLGLKMDDFVNLSVHPDGRHIAFSCRRRLSSEVWVMENFLPTGVSQAK